MLAPLPLVAVAALRGLRVLMLLALAFAHRFSLPLLLLRRFLRRPPGPRLN